MRHIISWLGAGLLGIGGSNFFKLVGVHGQIVVEADELFSGVLTNLGDIIDYNPDGEDPILTIFDYVEAMRCQLWKLSSSLS